MGGLLGGKGYVASPLSNYWGGLPPSSYDYGINSSADTKALQEDLRQFTAVGDGLADKIFDPEK